MSVQQKLELGLYHPDWHWKHLEHDQEHQDNLNFQNSLMQTYSNEKALPIPVDQHHGKSYVLSHSDFKTDEQITVSQVTDQTTTMVNASVRKRKRGKYNLDLSQLLKE